MILFLSFESSFRVARVILGQLGLLGFVQWAKDHELRFNKCVFGKAGGCFTVTLNKYDSVIRCVCVGFHVFWFH